MLRGHFVPAKSVLFHPKCVLQRDFTSSYALKSKLELSTNKQGKIMRKLFGERMPGSKKRWYPDSPNGVAQNAVFKASQFGKPVRGSGKNNIRRMTVLNKLFMRHISDMLATGAVSERILGCGLQITRVKISPDFACVNVYWLSSVGLLRDKELEAELQRCSGLLRHELSQLRLMGEVPHIHFVHDKTNANLMCVETMLKDLDLRFDDCDMQQKQLYDSASAIKNELFGHFEMSLNPEESDDNQEFEQLPSMRQDVLGLDHHGIMSKILTKMRKSKLAWETHNTSAEDMTLGVTEMERLKLDEINEKLTKSAETEDKLKNFLAQQRGRKTTPERKKHNRLEESLTPKTDTAVDDDPVLSVSQKRIYHEQDYIYEDIEDYSKK